jgi:hypothetical protein
MASDRDMLYVSNSDVIVFNTLLRATPSLVAALNGSWLSLPLDGFRTRGSIMKFWGSKGLGIVHTRRVDVDTDNRLIRESLRRSSGGIFGRLEDNIAPVPGASTRGY